MTRLRVRQSPIQVRPEPSPLDLVEICKCPPMHFPKASGLNHIFFCPYVLVFILHEEALGAQTRDTALAATGTTDQPPTITFDVE